MPRSPRLVSLSVVLGLLLFPCMASAAPVPQPRALAAAVRALDLPRKDDARLSHGRFALSFAVDRHHGSFMSPDPAVSFSVHGHGPSARRYRSVSLEVIFWSAPSLESNLAVTGRLIAGLGFSEEVRDTAVAMLRASVLRVRENPLGPGVDDVREAAGIQVRLERPTGMSSYTILQFTDADAPEADWPSPREVEMLQPSTRWRPIGATDVIVYADVVVSNLRCRPAGGGAFRCRYELVGGGDPEGPFSGGPYTDLFRRGADGRWKMEPARRSRPGGA